MNWLVSGLEQLKLKQLLTGSCSLASESYTVSTKSVLQNKLKSIGGDITLPYTIVKAMISN